MDPLKNYEMPQHDLFEFQINSMNKKIYEDKEIFGIIEEKINEIKYLLTGNKDFLKVNNNQTFENRKNKYKSTGRRRFSIFKTPLVVANIPTIKRNNKSLVSTTRINTITKNFTIEELDENTKNSSQDSLVDIKEKIHNKNQGLKSKLSCKSIDTNTLINNKSNLITDEDISRSHILINNPSVNDMKNIFNNNTEDIKRSTSDNNLLLNNSSPESNAIKFSDSKKSTMHESLISLNKKILDSYIIDDFLKDKCDALDLSIPYIKDDDEMLTNKKEMLINKLLMDESPIGLKNTLYNQIDNLYLTRSKSIRSSICSFKDRLINKRLYNIDDKKEFINQIKKEVVYIKYIINNINLPLQV